MKRTMIWAIALTMLLAWVNLAAAQERPKQPAPPAAAPGSAPAKKPHVYVTISKQTTYITAPLRADGYVNYVAALNQRFRSGVTPENNATVLFLKAMGPGDFNAKYREEYFRLLGIPPLPEKGDYYVDVEKYAKASKEAGRQATKEEEEKGQSVYWDQLTPAMKRPWSKKEFPVLAGWLAANEKPLALVVEASKRPQSYSPLVPEDGSVIAAVLPTLMQQREAARALTARAMLRLDEGKVDEAWEDLLACHRLARLVGRGPTLVDALVAITMDGMACAGDRGLLQHARPTSAQIARMRADLDQLPPLPKMGEKINTAERFMYCDSVGMLARGGARDMAGLTGGGQPKGLFDTLTDSNMGKAYDWDHVLRMGNSWYDRLADADGKQPRPEREKALDKIDGDVKKLAAANKDWKALGLAMLVSPRTARSEWLGRTLVCMLLPAVRSAIKAEDRATMQFDVTRLAFALAAYRADRGGYPVKLADLAPQYVAKVPRDIFNDAELHYRLQGGGYLLYSVGVNGKDDGGKSYDDRKGGEDWDDLAVRVPATSP